MNDFSYNLQGCLGFMTITANRLMSAALRRTMRESGIDLTAEQWGVLVLLWNTGGITQEELACVACVDKSSMSRVLTLMENKGLVTRRSDPANARRKIICPTDTADALRADSMAATQAALAQATAHISPEDCAICLKVLATIKQALQDKSR